MGPKNKEQLEKLRDLNDDDLAHELDETYRQLFTTRLQLSTQQLANTALPRKLKRQLARIITLQRERDIAAFYKKAQPTPAADAES